MQFQAQGFPVAIGHQACRKRRHVKRSAQHDITDAAAARIREILAPSAGKVTLDGEKALTYVRSRHHIDDQTNIARMARQRQFLAALEEKLRQQDSQNILMII